ncbi:MAG: hypothetical protein AB1755_04410 [Candidatus Omnitrophota bacterium]
MRDLAKNKIRLLKLFFDNPNHAYYMHEIGRILKKKPGVFQRTLYNLEKQGILLSEYKANARFFKANMKYPVYNELKAMVFKTFSLCKIA